MHAFPPLGGPRGAAGAVPILAVAGDAGDVAAYIVAVGDPEAVITGCTATIRVVDIIGFCQTIIRIIFKTINLPLATANPPEHLADVAVLFAKILLIGCFERSRISLPYKGNGAVETSGIETKSFQPVFSNKCSCFH